VGILLYLTHSRLDLYNAVGTISRFMQASHELHWKAAKWILRYVQGTITFGSHYAVNSTLDLIKFTDSDWARDSIDCKSTSSYSLSLGSSPICWSRKKQASIALYSAEVEYRGVANITIQAMWLQHFLTDLGIQFHWSIIIWCDKQSTLKFCKDLVQRQQMKNIKIHMHYIWDLVHKGIIELQLFPSPEYTTYIFTKTFTDHKFHSLRSRFGVKDKVS
jgi:hypothetical protein